MRNAHLETAAMHFVRTFTTNFRKLLEAKEEPASLASRLFDLDGSEALEQSVFAVTREDRGQREAEILAAHYLTLKRGHLDETYALRLFESDFESHGLAVDPRGRQAGETGVASVDGDHHDLVGSRDGFVGLMTSVLEAIEHGEDRIRILGKRQLAFQLQQWIDEESGEVDSTAKNRAQAVSK